MTWIDPPAKVIEARDAVVACAAAAALGCAATGAYHYPEAGLKTTALPFCVVTEGDDYQAERHAPGESYASGSIRLLFYLDPSIVSVGAAESAGRDIVHQLSELQGDHLFITSAVRSLCSRVRRSKVAATVDGAARSYFTMQIVINWEG